MDEPQAPVTDMDLDTCTDIALAALVSLSDQLRSQGMPNAAVSIAMFEAFTQSFMDRQDYDSWRHILESALEDPPWPTQSLH